MNTHTVKAVYINVPSYYNNKQVTFYRIQTWLKINDTDYVAEGYIPPEVVKEISDMPTDKLLNCKDKNQNIIFNKYIFVVQQ